MSATIDPSVLRYAIGRHAARKLAAAPLRALPAEVHELTATYGLTAREATRVSAVVSLARVLSVEPLERGQPFRDAATIFRAFHGRVRDLRVEQFWAILLDGKHRVLREVLVSQGTLTSSPVHPREVFAPAIRWSAAAVVLLHNHPSGDPAPSADDLEITRRLAEVGSVVGIRVVDHVVIGDGAYVSFADRGLLY